MDSIEESIDPLETKKEYDSEDVKMIKQEYDSEDVKIVGFEELMYELMLLKDIFLQAEKKLVHITKHCGFYFEDSNICDIKLLADRLQSAKTCLEQIDVNLRVKNEISDEEEVAISQLLLNHEFPVKQASRTEGSHSEMESSENSEEDELSDDNNNANSDLDYEPIENEDETEEAEADENDSTILSDSMRLRSGSACRNASNIISQPGKVKKKKSSRISPLSNGEPKKKRQGRPPILESDLVSCRICRKQLTSNGLPRHTQKFHGEGEFRFHCSQCPRKFHAKSAFINHSKTHSEVKSFVCEICGWAFHAYSNMLAHMKRHSEDRPLKCPHCEDTFKYSQSLGKHIQWKHSEKSNQCSTCGKLFALACRLKAHEDEVHKSLRKFSCHLCSKSFKRSQHLKRHASAHSDPNVKLRRLKTKKGDA